jgi:hypothetical protein
MQAKLDRGMRRHKPLFHTSRDIDAVPGGSVATKLRMRFANFSRIDAE